MTNGEHIDCGCELEIVTEEPRQAKPNPILVTAYLRGHRSNQIAQRPLR